MINAQVAVCTSRDSVARFNYAGFLMTETINHVANSKDAVHAHESQDGINPRSRLLRGWTYLGPQLGALHIQMLLNLDHH